MSLFNRYARFLDSVRDEFTFASWRSAERAFEEARIDERNDLPPPSLCDAAAPESACAPVER